MKDQDKDLLIKDLTEKLEKSEHEAASFKQRLEKGKSGAPEIVSETYTCKKVKGKINKKFRFKPGSNIFRLPSDVDSVAREKKVQRTESGIYHARDAIKSDVIMEHLIGVNSGLIEEVVKEKKG